MARGDPGVRRSSEQAVGEDSELDVPEFRGSTQIRYRLAGRTENDEPAGERDGRRGNCIGAHWLQVTSGFGVTPAAHSSSAGSNTCVQYSFDKSTSSGSTPPRCSRQTRRTSSQSRSHSHPPEPDCSSSVSQLRIKTGLTSYPCSRRSRAATLLSTPPDMHAKTGVPAGGGPHSSAGDAAARGAWMALVHSCAQGVRWKRCDRPGRLAARAAAAAHFLVMDICGCKGVSLLTIRVGCL